MCNFHCKLLCPKYMELCFPDRIGKGKKSRNKGLDALNEDIWKYKWQKLRNLSGSQRVPIREISTAWNYLAPSASFMLIYPWRKRAGEITGIVLYTQLVGGQTPASCAGWMCRIKHSPNPPALEVPPSPGISRIAALADSQQRSRSPAHFSSRLHTCTRGCSQGGLLPERQLLFTPFSPINLLRDDSRAKQSLSVQVAAVI